LGLDTPWKPSPSCRAPPFFLATPTFVGAILCMGATFLATPMLHSDLDSPGIIKGSPSPLAWAWLVSRCGVHARMLLRPPVWCFKRQHTVSPTLTTFCWACPRVRGGPARRVDIEWGAGTERGERRGVVIIIVFVFGVVVALVVGVVVVFAVAVAVVVVSGPISSSMKANSCRSPVPWVLFTCVRCRHPPFGRCPPRPCPFCCS
jgi:hypothetical protein